MKLEDQVTSIALSKRLSELGVKQDSIFYWLTSIHHKDEIITSNKLLNEKAYPVKQYSAFTASELGQMLPDWSDIVKRMENDWMCIVREKHTDKNHHSFAEKEADARAKMLIFLIENRIIEVPK